MPKNMGMREMDFPREVPRVCKVQITLVICDNFTPA